MIYLLNKVRLTIWFVIFFVLYVALSFILPKVKFESSALTLFSVNSFLYGFYIAPILSGQKARVEELHRIVRNEANALFSAVLKLKKLPKELRNEMQQKFRDYVKANLRDKRSAGGEEEYESLITFCLEYEGKYEDQVEKTLDSLIANEKNRTDLSMQLANKVFSNEWMIMFILFSITLGFIILIDVGDSLVLNFVRALLSTGLTMLVVILIKLSTLTHKKAKQIWDPLVKLIDTNFYRID